MRVVELLGIPGAGKSTLAQSVRDRLAAQGGDALGLKEAVARVMKEGVGDRLVDRVMSMLPSPALTRYAESGFIRSNALLVSMIEFMAIHPRAVAAYLEGHARRSDFEVGGDLVVRWFLQLVARYQLAASHLGEGAVLIMDEGFAQRAVTGFAHRFSEADHSDLDRYVSSVPRPDLLVCLRIGPEDAAVRLGDLDKGVVTKRLWGSDVDPAAFLADAHRCVDYVAETARRIGWEVIDVDASADREDLVARVTSQSSR